MAWRSSSCSGVGFSTFVTGIGAPTANTKLQKIITDIWCPNYTPASSAVSFFLSVSKTQDFEDNEDDPPFNPLTPRAFSLKNAFFGHLETKWARLAPIYLKGLCNMAACISFHKQHVLQHFCSGMHRNKKFRDFWTRKWPTSLGFLLFKFFCAPFLFLLSSYFCCSYWPSAGLASS